MISFVAPLVLSYDSLLATVLLNPFIKNKWQFAGLLGLFDGLAYLIGMTLPIAGIVIPISLTLIAITAGILLFKNKLPWAVALALSGDNFVQGVTRSSYLFNHGLLAKCFLSGSVFSHALVFGLTSFIMATLGLSLIFFFSYVWTQYFKYNVTEDAVQ